jgi:hypothetical protein
METLFPFHSLYSAFDRLLSGKIILLFLSLARHILSCLAFGSARLSYLNETRVIQANKTRKLSDFRSNPVHLFLDSVKPIWDISILMKQCFNGCFAVVHSACISCRDEESEFGHFSMILSSISISIICLWQLLLCRFDQSFSFSS